jgi:hypothetical protein
MIIKEKIINEEKINNEDKNKKLIIEEDKIEIVDFCPEVNELNS